MSDPCTRWYKPENPDLQYREWDGERVYHSARSGDTHLVTGIDFTVLVEIEAGTFDVHDLVAPSGDPDQDELARISVAASLDRLERLGLAVQQHRS